MIDFLLALIMLLTRLFGGTPTPPPTVPPEMPIIHCSASWCDADAQKDHPADIPFTGSMPKTPEGAADHNAVEDLPADSISDDPAYSQGMPEGGFLTPCAEDEVPTMIPDPEGIYPAGVWYRCIHIDDL
jgi:hypothetical protein